MVYRLRNLLDLSYANHWWVITVPCDKFVSLVVSSDVRRQRKHSCVSPVRLHSDKVRIDTMKIFSASSRNLKK